mgnify:FL=1
MEIKIVLFHAAMPRDCVMHLMEESRWLLFKERIIAFGRMILSRSAFSLLTIVWVTWRNQDQFYLKIWNWRKWLSWRTCIEIYRNSIRVKKINRNIWSLGVQRTRTKTIYMFIHRILMAILKSKAKCFRCRQMKNICKLE